MYSQLEDEAATETETEKERMSRRELREGALKRHRERGV